MNALQNRKSKKTQEIAKIGDVKLKRYDSEVSDEDAEYFFNLAKDQEQRKISHDKIE